MITETWDSGGECRVSVHTAQLSTAPWVHGSASLDEGKTDCEYWNPLWPWREEGERLFAPHHLIRYIVVLLFRHIVFNVNPNTHTEQQCMLLQDDARTFYMNFNFTQSLALLTPRTGVNSVWNASIPRLGGRRRHIRAGLIFGRKSHTFESDISF